MGGKNLFKDQPNLYDLLRTRKFLNKLIGNTEHGEIRLFSDSVSKKNPITMPYLSGADLCDLSTTFGLPMTYNLGGGGLSRWMYLDNLIEHCGNKATCPDLLTYIFSKRQFEKILSDIPVGTIDSTYEEIIESILKIINGALYFNNNSLV